MEPNLDRGQAYYRDDLALVHHEGFGHHADVCAPGILKLLEPIRERGGVVVEVGCGSGLLTRHLVEAGHRVIATDASNAMLALARDYVGGDVEIRRVVLPDDPIPAADAIVGIGHCLNYLGSEQEVDEALMRAAARSDRAESWPSICATWSGVCCGSTSHPSSAAPTTGP